MFLSACVQLCSNEDLTHNLDKASAMITRAAQHGAQLIMTPENTPLLGPKFHKVDEAQDLSGDIVQYFQALSKKLKVHLLLGSFAERHYLADGQLDTKRCYNTSLMIDDHGEILARYRKIHLFDVDVPQGPSLKESEFICAGDEVMVVDTRLGKIGMSICYDLRFPELYRALVDQGAEIICVPSAFTLTTGKDHWHTLLRARAIETQSWIMAPGQWGQHDAAGQRQSYGHSLIINPWGTVVADAGLGEGICYAEIDLQQVYKARQAIPLASHRTL